MANWTFIKLCVRPGRTALLLCLVGGLSLWASSIDFASPPTWSQHVAPGIASEPQKDHLTQLLNRALLSREHVFFSGEQTILAFDEGDGSACVTQETHLGPDRYRISYQNPIEVRGRVQIADAGSFQHYLPQTHTLVKRRLAHPSLSTADMNARVQHIRQNYLLTLAEQTENLNGRTAYILDILPRTKDRPRQKLWIDTQTSLVLRRETYNAAGNQTAVTFWRNLTFYHSPSEESLRWTPPEGTRMDTGEEELPLSLSEARARASSWAVVPEKLGEGFYFDSARILNAGGTPGLYCTYSDGLCTLSLVQLTGTQSFQTGNGTITPLPIASYDPRNAQIASRGSVNILSWISTRRKATLSLLGELTEDTLVGLAEMLP